MSLAPPSPETLSRTFTALLGRTVSVKRAAAPAARAPAVAVYATATAPAAVVCLVDLPLACSLGAALSMIPAPVASQSAKAGQLAPNLLENLVEVMNVGTATLAAGSPVRLALSRVFSPGEAIPAEAAAVRSKPSTRVDYEITVSGYEPGTLTVLGA